MNSDYYEDLTDETLAWLRTQDHVPLALITALLGAADMAREDHLLTSYEVMEYVESGDVGAARALLQHAKARRQYGARSCSDRPD
jgi:hypothetical protein